MREGLWRLIPAFCSMRMCQVKLNKELIQRRAEGYARGRLPCIEQIRVEDC
jgi:hypothetical protein